MGLFENLFKSSSDGDRYNDRWLKSASDEELDTEREKVRLAHCAGNEHAQNILYRFDDEKRRRSSAGHEDEEPGYPVHREHGWYLPNDD